MRKQIQRFLLLAFAALTAAGGYAYDVKIDGIFYDLDKYNRTASVTNRGVFDTYTGNVSIPASITSGGTDYSVTTIGNYAFSSCTGLTSVTIPSSVTTIELSAFSGCTGLTSVTIPSSVTSIESSAFSSCTGLTSVTIPSSVTAIGNYAFYDCTGLTSVTIPSSVKTIGNAAFSGCTGLTSVTIPSSVTSIGNAAFGGCTGLTSVTISSSVTTIENYAFRGCTGLTSVTIPSSVTTIEAGAFRGCVLRALYWYGMRSSYWGFFSGLNTSVIYAYESEINAIKSAGYSNVYNIEKQYYVVSLYKRYLRGISFSLVGNELVPGTLQSVKIGDAELSSDGNGIYTATGLDVATNYYIIVTYVDESGVEKTLTETVSTLSPSVSVMKKSTQTTLSLSINASSDETCTVGERGFLLNGETYKYTDTPVTVSGLVPNTSYTVTPYAWYGSKKVTGNASKLTTAALAPAVVPGEVGPTSFIATGRYAEGDAHVSEVGFEGICEGNALTMTGLKPETAYTVTYYVRTEEGSEETTKYSFRTSALELTTEQPKCVSSSCAVVAATTNISDEEPNVGFQWKKYDAPESFRPSEGYAAIYGGQLEGYIRNLQPTSYYNVRAFYKAADETYYYGEWVTFDPSDFSFFEPTVHTYPATEVSHSSVRVRGYVLAGTDDITEQGFQYWPAEAGAARAQAVQAILADAFGNDVTTVLATGQVMTTVLSGLRPSTTYCCRAFVKTAAGVTYGEEQTFTTAADLTGIGSVEAEESVPTIVGYYDLKGHRFTSPQRGINIVRYSDGTTRKVFVK